MGKQRGSFMAYFIIAWSLAVFLAESKVEGNAIDKYFHVGCYKEDLSNRALPILLANYSHGDQSNIDKVRSCVNTAYQKGYKAFGMQNNGECWSGIDAMLVYAKYGKESSCRDGVGGVNASDVYLLQLKLSHLGCFNENPADRAMPVLVANKNTSDPNPIKSCARAAWLKGFTKVFGLQNGGECWSGNNTDVTYNKHGYATGVCGSGNGTGGHLKIAAYRIDTTGPTTSIPQVKVPALTTPSTADRICPSGSISKGSPKTICQPCPVDHYKHNNNQCKPCESGKKTWGRKGVATAGQCTAENPIKISSLEVNIPPDDVKPGMIVANFTATYKQGSLVIAPLTYTVTGVTKSPQGRTSDVTSDDIDACSRPASNSSFPFCIYHDNGSIAINKNFNCSEGDKYVISINVSDSGNDTIGTIINPNGKVTINCVDVCKDVKRLYEEASNDCSKTNITDINNILLNKNCIRSALQTLLPVSTQPESCDGNWKCLDAVFNWTNSPNFGKCGSDPDNLLKRYEQFVAKPQITSGLLFKNVTSGTPVTLSCRVSSPLPANITWYNGTHKVFKTNITITMDVDNQGYYWCQASNRYGTRQSGRALLVVTDYFTSLISFKVENKPNKNSQDPCQSCGQIAGYLSSQDTSRDAYKHRTTCRHWEVRSNKLGVECVIYGKKKSQEEDLDSYYRNLVGMFTDGALRKNKIKDFKISWESVLVKDTGMCTKEITGKPNIQGFFSWESTTIGDSQTVECPLGPSGSYATRTCGGNFNTGAVWNKPVYDNCTYKSKKTDAMKKFSKIKATPGNVKEVSRNFTKVLKSISPEDMSEADADIAAEMVDNILSVEDRINETAGVVVEIIDTMMGMNSSNLKAKTSARIIKALDKVAEKIPLENGTSKVLNSSNLAIQANAVDTSTFNGLGFGISKNANGGKSVVTNANTTSLFVRLPRAALENANKSSGASIRIGFIYFANNKLFTEEDEDDLESERKPSDEVLSSSVFNTNTSNLSENVTLSFPRPTETKDLKSCVYWNEQVRRWSNEGCFPCASEGDNKDSVKCCCNHLTSFAVLFSTQDKPVPLDEKHARILSIISYVGCGISLVGVVLTFLTYLLFRHLRKTNQQPILMSLCVAIGLLLIVFVVGIDRTDDKLGCQISAALLHYFSLATVLWMGVEAYNLYLQLVKVMAIYHRKFMLKASIFAWGVPAVIVIATVVAAVIEYNADETSGVFYYGNRQACILHNFTYRMVSWFVPILVTIFFNLIMFILVIYKLNCTGAMIPVDTKSNQKKRCWTALAIMSLLGLTWLFGALAIAEARLVFEYLFCIFNSLQGFFIFFFHCIRIKEVRNQWSFFVSGLGFSHRESETSNQRSRGIGESRHSSDAPYVKVKNWILRKESNGDQSQPKRKITMTTDIDDKNIHGNVYEEKKVDIELDEVDPHENDALEDSGGSNRRDSHSSKGSSHA